MSTRTARRAAPSRRTPPTFALEAPLWASGAHLVAGVDEVGRGPLALPVVSGCAVLHPDSDPAAFSWVRDSKMLSKAKIDAYASAVRRGAYRSHGLLAWGLGAASPEEIDRLNIRRATIVAMERAVAAAERRLVRQGLLAADEAIPMLLVDGEALPECRYPHEAVPKADALSISVGIGSIMAKSFRSYLARRAAIRFPAFACWADDDAYPTPAHKAALETHGPIPGVHRWSYAPVRAADRPR